ncbi:MAG TPA: gluconate 2-dehydrogenase subunit 3 family protein [Bryobacteraceae bacterium]|nr:gluconate 2-dehydrogenase subunit 3 family protein [Bryobacteraceae bacterium]
MSEPINPAIPLSDLPDVSRRNLFRIVGVTAFSAEMLAAQTAKDTPPPPMAGMSAEAVAANPKSLNGGPNYVPKHLKQHQFKTLRHLGDLIMPADATSPAASEAGAAEFIDFLCSRNEDLANIFDGGLAWLDEYMIHKHGTDFLSSKPDQQTAVLDLAYGTRGGSPEVAAGAQFFTWARNMVVDAYYTSPVGVKDIGYKGNTARSSFSVPQEAVDYALKRSPFGS